MISLEGELLGVRQLEHSGGVGIFFELKGGTHAVVTVPEMKEPLTMAVVKGKTTNYTTEKGYQMNALIAINTSSINNETKQTVNARDLHEFLESKRQFADWIKERVDQFGFVENQDFVTYSQNSEKGRPSKEYALTLDMAKELSMVERNEKGKHARQYFIECERRALQPATPELQLANAVLLAGRMIEEKNLQIEQRDKLIADITPKAQALDRLSLADGSLCITDAAKTLQVAPKKFFSLLQQHKWIYRRAGCEHWIGYQDKLQQQLLEHKTTTVTRTDGTERISEQVRVTPKGLSKLATIFQEAA